MRKVRVGIVGTGAISSAYFQGAARSPVAQIVAAADLDVERVKTKLQDIRGDLVKWGLPEDAHQDVRPCSVDELIAADDVDIVLNLTVPKAHAAVSLKAIAAGKHVYLEKPLGVNRAEGKAVMAAAKAKRVRVGCAPDTFLGGGIQTCRKLIDDGWIGQPVAATAFMVCGGHESWHPSPEFYYEVGGGPMFDMGPYYLTALVNMLGPVLRVAGLARTTHETRRITSKPKFGKIIDVETPTHIASSLQFASGPIASVIMSFDTKFAQLPLLQIIGTEGTLLCPDPNQFGGPIKYRRGGMSDWQDVPLLFPQHGRFIGIADLASAILNDRPHRVSGELANHVLDVMQASLDVEVENRTRAMETTCERPAPMPSGLAEWEVD
jgi:predicted dehydrogenase